jgi:predicted nucleotidyltransferase
MKSVQATELRRQLYQRLDEVERRRAPLEVLRFGKPIAVLAPAPSARRSNRRPLIDLDAISDFCVRHGVDAFSLFGSILRDDFGAKSDVDVLIDAGDRALGFHETCRMLDELEAMFGRKVDMLTRSAVASPDMNSHRRASILSTARLLYERAR